MKTKYIIKQLISLIYEKIFARKIFYPINQFMHYLTCRSLGIQNSNSGEDYFLTKVVFLHSKISDGDYVVFDVGANTGCYSNQIKSIIINSRIFAFEPHPKTFLILQHEGIVNGFQSYNVGCGETPKKSKIYDYLNNDGSQHASFFQEVFSELRKEDTIEHDITIIKLDDFLKEKKIEKIHLLKIDVEGNELNVLKGLKESLNNNIIEIIHFEFNEMNVVSRVFFKDFYDILINFQFYRMLPYGLIPLGEYNPIHCEIFSYQNIVAIRHGCNLGI